MSEPYNQLSPAEAERLACLIEECGEVIQAATKILRHGYESVNPRTNESNRDALMREVGDMLFVLTVMSRAIDINDKEVHKDDGFRHYKATTYSHHNIDLLTTLI
jgi:NTP pyrophosphatase (non-canonical NTP hydrolase)